MKDIDPKLNSSIQSIIVDPSRWNIGIADESLVSGKCLRFSTTVQL